MVSIEAKIKRAQLLDRISNKILEQKLKEVYEIEAKLQTEAWTVITQTDTIMLRTWVNKASKFQAEMENGAFAPEPIQLSTDALFSAPMLSRGRRRVQGVKMLRKISRGALKENRPRIDKIIKVYEKQRTWKHQHGRKHRRQINEQTKGQALHRQNQATLQQNNDERRRAKRFRHSFGRSESGA